MMRVLKVLWGLLVDDARLAVGLVVTLVAAAICVQLHHAWLGAVAIWAGLVLSLWFSVNYPLQQKLKK